MPALVSRFLDRPGRAPMVSVMVVRIDSRRWISKGPLWPNRPETRANADASRIDGKSDGKSRRSDA